MTKKRSNSWLWLGALLIVLVGLAFWQLFPVNHMAEGISQKKFAVEVPFDRFRTIMVRKNATAAIVAHAGMELIDEQLSGLALDASQDERPLINAIRGKSKTELSATREIVVRLTDPQIQADRLTLEQQAEVKPDLMQVRTQSKEPAGRLQSYETTLDATPKEQAADQSSVDSTEVALSVTIHFQMKVPRLFTGRVDREVQASADSVIQEQAQAIQDFIQSHQDELIILPDL